MQYIRLNRNDIITKIIENFGIRISGEAIPFKYELETSEETIVIAEVESPLLGSIPVFLIVGEDKISMFHIAGAYSDLNHLFHALNSLSEYKLHDFIFSMRDRILLFNYRG